MDKFIETMPTIIQTHLFFAPNWEEVTKKAKNLEHIIRRCEPPASRGFNHSPKHCFMGEHDINNLMEKMSLGSNNQHQNGSYQ